MKRRIIIRRHARPAGSASAAKSAGAVKRTSVARPITKALDKITFENFNPSILGLGNINVPSKEIEACAAVFDLSGFTKFCNQVDPYLAVPEFLSQFLSWLFNKIKSGLITSSYTDHKEAWADLPFLAKFLGDGVLFLWNTKGMDESRICDIVSTVYDICYAYRHNFCPEIRKAMANPPDVLRCGVARGKVFTVGNGGDYIGHCINLAARLQKLSLLTFCFPRRGFDVQNRMRSNLKSKVIEKRASIRGILESDLVWVLKEEFDSLPDREKQQFGQP